MFGVGSPEVRSHMVAGNAFLFPLVLDLADGRGQCGQFYLADQYLLLAGGSIHIPQFTMLAGVIALDEREFSVVRTPLDCLGSSTGDAAFGENRFNRERFFSCALGVRRLGHRPRDKYSKDYRQRNEPFHAETPGYEASHKQG